MFCDANVFHVFSLFLVHRACLLGSHFVNNMIQIRLKISESRLQALRLLLDLFDLNEVQYELGGLDLTLN
jgi:hypothetical protein